jgi:hypothetical protein
MKLRCYAAREWIHTWVEQLELALAGGAVVLVGWWVAIVGEVLRDCWVGKMAVQSRRTDLSENIA